MKETRWEYIEPVETEGKCQPRNKNSQQINANDQHTGKLKRRKRLLTLQTRTRRYFSIFSCANEILRGGAVIRGINKVSVLNLL